MQNQNNIAAFNSPNTFLMGGTAPYRVGAFHLPALELAIKNGENLLVLDNATGFDGLHISDLLKDTLDAANYATSVITFSKANPNPAASFDILRAINPYTTQDFTLENSQYDPCEDAYTHYASAVADIMYPCSRSEHEEFVRFTKSLLMDVAKNKPQSDISLTTAAKELDNDNKFGCTLQEMWQTNGSSAGAFDFSNLANPKSVCFVRYDNDPCMRALAAAFISTQIWYLHSIVDCSSEHQLANHVKIVLLDCASLGRIWHLNRHILTGGKRNISYTLDVNSLTELNAVYPDCWTEIISGLSNFVPLADTSPIPCQTEEVRSVRTWVPKFFQRARKSFQ